ncbi:MAG: biotin/lipoyl-binding protein, partial [Chloroflexi bacterium]|nr:biotin/lipoyl-binding protein [Chloroflexota bacterium]
MRNELEQVRNLRWRWPAMALLLGAVALLVAACGGSGDGNDEEEQRVDVVRGDIEISVSASGNVSFPKRRSLTFGSAGSVDRVMVEEGDRVRAGQTLAMLESSDLEKAVAKAEVDLATALENLSEIAGGVEPQAVARARELVVSSQTALQAAQEARRDALQPFSMKETSQQAEAVANAQLQLQTAQ